MEFIETWTTDSNRSLSLFCDITLTLRKKKEIMKTDLNIYMYVIYSWTISAIFPGRMGVYTAIFVCLEHTVIRRVKLRVLCANQVSGHVCSTITAWHFEIELFLFVKICFGEYTLLCFQILGWNLVTRFAMKSYRSSLTLVRAKSVSLSLHPSVFLSL